VGPSEWKRITELNLSLPGMLVSRYLGTMMEKSFGRIVLFGGSATDTIRGYRKTSVYAAAKTALGVIARSVAKQYARYNISCNVICPGYVDTEYYTEEEKRKIRAKMPQNILISTEEIADMVEYVLLRPSINGTVIPVNSGILR
jgi:NAD(P)-dependent dehydrogenase (short-subunit alcohol dehydrogenase family)